MKTAARKRGARVALKSLIRKARVADADTAVLVMRHAMRQIDLASK